MGYVKKCQTCIDPHKLRPGAVHLMPSCTYGRHYIREKRSVQHAKIPGCPFSSVEL